MTIRAFHTVEAFIQTNYYNLNRNTAALFAFLSSARWLGSRLDLLSVVVMVVVTFGAVAAKQYGSPVAPPILAVGIM